MISPENSDNSTVTDTHIDAGAGAGAPLSGADDANGKPIWHNILFMGITPIAAISIMSPALAAKPAAAIQRQIVRIAPLC